MSTLIKAGQGLAIFLALARKKKFHPRSQKDQGRMRKKEDAKIRKQKLLCDRDLSICFC
jgi:hypothetical protein